MALNKYIIASAENENKLITAVQALANLYATSGFTDEIKIQRVLVNTNDFILTFSNIPDLEHFNYFVNYMHYPETGSFGTVRGYWLFDDKDKGVPKEFIGSRIMLYVAADDTEYDNVFGVLETSKEHYKFGFSSGENLVKLDRSEPSFKETLLDYRDFQFITNIQPDEAAITQNQKSSNKGIGCMIVLPIILLLSAGLLFIA